MKTTEEFLTYYQANIEPRFTRNVAQKPKSKLLKLIIPLSLLISLLFFMLASGNWMFATLVFMGIMITIILNIDWNYVFVSELNPKLREKVLTEMLKFYAPEMAYQPISGMLDKTIEISNLFDGYDYHTYYNAEGKINDTFCQLACLYNTEGDKNQQTGFTGMFLLTTFNKSFYGQYVVYSGFHLAPYVNIPGQHGPVKLKEIKLESPEFNSLFSVYGTGDEVETRYLFTPAMMQRMVELSKAYSNRLHFAFARNHIFFAIATPDFPFTEGLNALTDAAIIESWNNLMHFTLSLPEQFHLDEHLWSKP